MVAFKKLSVHLLMSETRGSSHVFLPEAELDALSNIQQSVVKQMNQNEIIILLYDRK